MAGKARLYVEGESRAVDDLAKTYSKIESVPEWAERSDEEERDPTDPFGFKVEKKKSDDPFEEAKLCAERITSCFAIIVSEYGLSAEQAIYAMELTAMNVFNDQHCPIPAAKVEQIREAAFRYYEASLKKIPDVKKK